MKEYTEFIGKHKGECAFVVGAGTSLEGLRKSEHFSLIHEHIVISINSAILLMPWAIGLPDKRYWVSVDSSVRLWTYWKRVQKSVCHKLVKTSWEKYYDFIPDFYIFPTRPTGSGTINPDDMGCICASSVPAAIDFALQTGCSKVFLLGVDHYLVQGTISHFWQFWMPQERPVGPLNPISIQERIFEKNLPDYKALQVFAEQKNAEIYNCSELSKVEEFKKIDFGEALELCQKNSQQIGLK